MQVAIAVVACCVEHSSGQACYDTTREVGDWPPDEAPTSLRASRLQQADKFWLAFYLTELLLVIIFVSLVLYSFLQLIFSLLCTLLLYINFIFLNLCLFVLFFISYLVIQCSSRVVKPELPANHQPSWGAEGLQSQLSRLQNHTGGMTPTCTQALAMQGIKKSLYIPQPMEALANSPTGLHVHVIIVLDSSFP